MIDSVINYRYEILERIGQGTFFTIYKARDKVLNKLVAVKVLLPEYEEDTEFGERICAGASSTIGLTHANVARVYESGHENGKYFVVTEYVRGNNLKERIGVSAPFSLAQSTDIAIAVAEALESAHMAGIIHGDVRPQNIMITPEGQIKVTDFGTYSALIGSKSGKAEASLRTVHYMSPEVAEGQIPQPESDQYSLGIILYEMLTGHVPFDGDSPITIALKQVQDPAPSPRKMNPGIPKALEGITLKALKKDPNERYKSIADMLKDLKNVRDALRYGKSLSWSPLDPNSGNRPDIFEDENENESVWKPVWKTLSYVAGGLVLLLVAGILYLQFSRPKDARVPDVVGVSASQAEQTLKDAGFDVTRSERYDDKVPADTVISTVPEADRSIKRGEKVLIMVSKGPEYIQVPEVTGASLSDAQKTLKDANLDVSVSEEYSDSIESRHVISQNPGGGNSVAPGSKVHLVISKGSEPIQATPSEPTEKASAKTRNIGIRFDVPNGDDPQHIRILVTDDDGEHTVVDDNYSPGDSIQQEVEVRGKSVRVRVYKDDELLKEENK